MATIEESIEIRAPIDQVYAAVTDPRRTIEWNPSIIDVGNITGLPPGVGTSWHQVASVAGRTVTLDCTIVSLTPPTEGILHVTGDQQGQIVMRLVDLGGATKLSQIIEFEAPSGLRGRMTMGFVLPILKREMSRTMERQRQVLEAEAGIDGGSRTA